MMAQDKYLVRLEDIINFVLPSNQQHPLTAGRLYAYGECGPLDEFRNLRAGFMGKHVISDYELNEMCLRYEREDVISVYLHREGDLGKLSSIEDELIISQADNHLKCAKGKALLPRLSRNDIIAIFKDLERREDDLLSFHDVQNAIMNFRRERVKKYKLMYPTLCSKKNMKSVTSATARPQSTSTAKDYSMMRVRPKKEKPSPSKRFRVSDQVAPPSMFEKMKGQTPADITNQTTKLLNHHGFKVLNSSMPASDLSSNVKLLRELDGRTLRRREESEDHPKWDATCCVRGTHLGSAVKSIPSNTTWKQKVTLY